MYAHQKKKIKWVWSGNTTIKICRQTHGTARKSHTTITRHQEDKPSKATSPFLPTKTTAKPDGTQSNAQQNTEQPQIPTMETTANNKLTRTEPPPRTDSSPSHIRAVWSESLIGALWPRAQRFFGRKVNTYHTVGMRKLISIVAVRTGQHVPYAGYWLNYLQKACFKFIRRCYGHYRTQKCKMLLQHIWDVTIIHVSAWKCYFCRLNGMN